MSDSTLPPALKTRFDDAKEIHRGRSGLAYRVGEGDDAKVLRVLRGSLSKSATDRMRISRGLDKLRGLKHAGLATPTDRGEEGGRLWYLRPYIAGETLSERVAKGPLPPDEALSIIGQLADALHALHRAGLLHRDLSPDRIILGEDGRATLIDSTVAAPLDDDHPRLLGHAAYLSPEEIAGKPSTFRSDLYALGCVAYAALTGDPPFEGDTKEVLEAHKSKSPEELEVEIAPEAKTILDQLLDKEPRRRPFSAQKVAKSLFSYIPAALRPAPRPAAPRASAPPKLSKPRPAKKTLIGVSAPKPGAKPGARAASIPPPVPEAIARASRPPPGGRKAKKRTMLGMPTTGALSTQRSDDVTQQVSIEQIVEAREVRKSQSAADTAVGVDRRGDATAPVQLEQIVEVRSSKLPPPPAPALSAPAAAADDGFEDDSPTQMFDSADLTAPAVPKDVPGVPASDESGFDDDEPTQMYDGSSVRPPALKSTPPATAPEASDDDDSAGGVVVAATAGVSAAAASDADADATTDDGIVAPPAALLAAVSDRPPARDDAPVVLPAAAASGGEDDEERELPPWVWALGGAAAALLLVWFYGLVNGPEEVASSSNAPASDNESALASTTTGGPDLSTPPSPPDLGPPDLGRPDLGVDLGPPDLGVDLGPPDLGVDLGPPDLGPPDMGALVAEADEADQGVEEPSDTPPRGRAARRRWLAERRARARAEASASMASSGGNSASAVRERARAAYRAGNYAQAARHYEQLTRMSPRSAGAWAGLGSTRMRMRNGRGAVLAYERATRIAPRNANYWAMLGHARRNSGNAAGARSAFQQALRLDPNNSSARRGLGR